MSVLPHIFVVDDEPAAREMVGDYLKLHGFKVTLCEGGASLRQAMAKDKPDLIVLDLNMPEEDGLSIVRDLKSKTKVAARRDRLLLVLRREGRRSHRGDRWNDGLRRSVRRSARRARGGLWRSPR